MKKLFLLSIVFLMSPCIRAMEHQGNHRQENTPLMGITVESVSSAQQPSMSREQNQIQQRLTREYWKRNKYIAIGIAIGFMGGTLVTSASACPR